MFEIKPEKKSHIDCKIFLNNIMLVAQIRQFEKKGLMQVCLSEKLCKSYNMVNSYVQNRRQPSIEVLFEIAKILGVKPKDLLKDKK